MSRLHNRIAIITGAANGLGEADARIFVREGAQVVLADINDERGEALAVELGPSASFRHLDVRDETAWESLIADTVDRFGRLDILVNSAGIIEFTTPETVTLERARLVMGINLEGTILGCKYAIPAMKRGGGSIINMSSVAARAGDGLVAVYCASKAAVESYSRAVAVYCAQTGNGIRCNTVNPTMIDTPLVRAIPEKIARLQEAMPDFHYPPQALNTNEKGQAEDVAAAILFLASEESRFINGASIVIDNTCTITMGAVPVAPEG